MSKLILFFCSLLLTVSSLAQADGVCQVLALQGGGDKGAYEAGAIWALVNNGISPSDTKYNFITGVSIGAINAAFMSQYSIGQEIEMATNLVSRWKSIKASDLYKEWFGGIVAAVLFKPSIYDLSPGFTYLKKILLTAPKRPINVGATNANTGLFTVFDETLSRENFITAVLSSAAMPMIFQYQNFQGKTYIDGGVVRNLDIGTGVNRCKAAGYSESQIIVDIIMCTGASLDNVELSGYTTVSIILRTLELSSFKGTISDVAKAQQDFPNVNFRYVIMPSKKLPSGSVPIGFNPSDISTMIETGKQDALIAIQKGAGVSFQDVVRFANKYLAHDKLEYSDILGKLIEERSKF